MTVVASPLTSANLIRNVNAQLRSPIYRSSAIPRVHLPDPPSLYNSLVAIGAEEMIAKEMDRAYHARALELRLYYEKFVRNVSAAFPHDSEKQILDTVGRLYLEKVSTWIGDALTAYKSSWRPAKQVVSNEAPRNANLRRTFNTDYVPFLERFFDDNPLPTHADKVFLANKSGMTYRQIHVWNRRNRTKKLNGTCRRKTAYEHATLPLDGTRRRFGGHIVHNEQSPRPPLEASCSVNSGDQNSMRRKHSFGETVPRSMVSRTENDNVLDKCTAPLHAFPSPYPPVGACNPFALESRGLVFSSFQWKRRPNHNTSLQISKIDIDDLVNRFTLLNVRDIYSKRSQRSHKNQDSLTGTCFTITPPPAPHPALIRPVTVVSSRARWPPLPIVRASPSTSQVFGPTVSSIPILPPSHSEGSISWRKFSPQLKQYPHQSLHCPDVTPATSDVSSPLSPPCSPLRTLSDSSDFGKELSLASCPSSPTPHLLPPQPQTYPTT